MKGSGGRLATILLVGLCVFLTIMLILSNQKLNRSELMLSQILSERVPNTNNSNKNNSNYNNKAGASADYCTRRHTFHPSEKGIFVVTPTYARNSQLVDLTRVQQALHIASLKLNILWILIEDAAEKTELVLDFVERSPVAIAHLNIHETRSANSFKANTQRNLALSHIMSLDNVSHLSAIYFADDDNAYDARLFDEIAKVRTVGVWPVAFSGDRRVETPVVTNGKVSGFQSWAGPRKKFPVDMAGFAVSTRYLFELPTPIQFMPNAPTSTGEEKFLLQTGIEVDELQPLANDCTEVLVWHVKTAVRSNPQFDGSSPQIKYA